MIDIMIFLLGMLGGAFLMAVVNGNAYERGCNDTWDWIGEYVAEELKEHEAVVNGGEKG